MNPAIRVQISLKPFTFLIIKLVFLTILLQLCTSEREECRSHYANIQVSEKEFSCLRGFMVLITLELKKGEILTY